MVATSSPVPPPPVNAAVEGIVDEAILNRVFLDAGVALNRVYIAEGKANLLQRLPSYNHAARWQPWVVLIDLDQDAPCAPMARERWLSVVEPALCFRIAVRAVESWLLADPSTLAEFLRVPIAQIPSQPEAEADPKVAMVNLARRSRRSAIVQDMIPRPGSGRSVGPAYSSRMIEFASQHWRPAVARESSDSLQRLFRCLARMILTDE